MKIKSIVHDDVRMKFIIDIDEVPGQSILINSGNITTRQQLLNELQSEVDKLTQKQDIVNQVKQDIAIFSGP